MALFGITAVRRDKDGWVDQAIIGEIANDQCSFVTGTTEEKTASDIAVLIKKGHQVCCVFGSVEKRGPFFEIISVQGKGERIKVVNDSPDWGIEQLMQLKKIVSQNNPITSW